MNPVLELMEAGSLIMLLFAAVLIFVVLRNVENPARRSKKGPILIGIALLLFSVPIYASVLDSSWFQDFSTLSRIVASVVLPIGLFYLAPLSRESLAEPVEEVDHG